MRRPRFLIIDDERNFREFLAEALEVEGYGVTQAATARAGLALARQELPQIILLDQNLPDGSGLDLIHDLRALPSNPVIIMITAFAGYDNAVRAVKAGAFHYLNKPFGFPDLLDVVAEACVAFPALGELGELEMLGALVGAHPRMEQVKQRIARIARTPVSTVLIRGESGTGKEVAAQALHRASDRASQRMVCVNCAALTESLLMDELFGHERGAFTDARSQREGVFEHAHGGTLFLDEISEMGARAQAALLRVLEQRCVRRIGGATEIPVDVRVLAATNTDLEEQVASGQFRGDLYYRLNVVQVELPPLRERRSDVAILASHFSRVLAERYNEPVRSITPEAMALLEAHDWPGNVRELRNTIERAYIVGSGPDITPGMLADELSTVHRRPAAPPLADVSRPFQELKREVLDDFERSYLESALARAGGNITQAAEEAGMLRQVFQRMLARHGMSGEMYKR
jgi:two-component system NtrC family response regulator